MKKRLFLSAIFFFGLFTLQAQTPQGFNYQAVIRDANGDVLAGKDVGMKISILQGSFTGTLVYSETFSPTTNNFGIVNLMVGSGEVVSGNFSTIDWSTANYFIKVELDANKTNSFTEMGTSQLLSVPYANYAFSGIEGESAYETWLKLGNTGTEEVFIDSITGSQGEPGIDGKSSYEVWLETGNTGTEQQYFDSITGPKGDKGLSSYQVWLSMGNTGTEKQYIDSITGPQGVPGLSAYQVWLALGNIGTETDFIKSLTGPSGTNSWVDSAQAVSTSKKVGIGTNKPTALLQVNGPSVASAAPLFEVKNSTGKTIFAIYENDVKVYLEKTGAGSFTVNSRDGNNVIQELLSVTPKQTTIYVDSSSSKATRGGFAVSGRTSTKGVTVPMLNITTGLTEIFVDEQTAKATRGGFAVSGRTSTKSEPVELLNITTGLTEFFVDQQAVKATRGGFAVSGRTSTKGISELLNITTDFTRFYVDSSTTKATRGGFAVSGRTSTKGTGDEIFMVTPNLTEVFVDETAAKATRGGFAVSGRTSTKATETFDILHVQPKSTDIFIKADPSSKSFPDGFTISGYNDNFDPFQLFAVSELGTVVNTDLSVAPKLTTNNVTNITVNSARSGGKVIDNNNVEITAIGIIYNLSGDLTINTDFSNQAIAGKVVGNVLAADDFSGLLMQNLSAAKQYQVRSYATNAEGLTGYGPIKTFTTLP